MKKMKIKICHKCNIKKDISEFHKDKYVKDGYSNDCKICVLKERKIYRDQNKELLSEIAKKSYQIYKEERKLKAKIYRETNKEKILIAKKKYYQKNKEKIQKQHNNYRKTHKKETNRHARNRLKLDINFKLRMYLKNRLRCAIKTNPKFGSTLKLVGCSIDKLKQHLESKFTKCMVWKNYGFYGWHIDHIRPCALFDLSKLSQQYQCFHYTNLQPLWAIDNLRKGNKYD